MQRASQEPTMPVPDAPGPQPTPLHVAIIMDGNVRWAAARGYSRTHGHRQGVKTARAIIRAAGELGITTLTLYAFSADNWRRPKSEVASLMRMFRRYLVEECQACIDNGIRLEVIGRRDRLSQPLRDAIQYAENATCKGDRLHLRVAIDYSARAAILQAADWLRGRSDVAFSDALAEVCHVRDTVDVDLLIRPGGEKRLSDFLLWECAYAELMFSDRLWPDFSAEDLRAALRDYRNRERRFGGLPETGFAAPASLGVAHG